MESTRPVCSPAGWQPEPPADCVLSDAGYSLQTFSRAASETSAVTQCETDKRARRQTSCAFLSGGDRAKTGWDSPHDAARPRVPLTSTAETLRTGMQPAFSFLLCSSA